jgi:outer membrane protein
MKQVIKLSILAIAMMVSSTTFGQGKIGHINFQELVELMPQTKKVKDSLDKIGKQWQSILAEVQGEYEKKAADYEKFSTTWSQPVQETKLKAIQELKARYEQTTQKAQEDYTAQSEKLQEPVVKAAKEAISAVAKEGGYAAILDVNVMLYSLPADNVMAAVKKKLGIL